MGQLRAFAVTVVLAGGMLAPHAVASESDPLEKRVAITLRRDGGKVTLVLKATDGHAYVNSAFPTWCELQSTGPIDKARLAKADFTIEDSGKPGKARSMSALIGAQRPIHARCRLVACSDAACSSPFSMEAGE